MDEQGEGGGRIVGSIQLARSEDEAPTFTVVRHKWDKDIEAARPCEHGSFTLDEEWSTVTCRKCKEKVDPFRALMFYVDWWERFKQDRAQMVEARIKLVIENLRRLRRLRDTTEGEAVECDAMIQKYAHRYYRLAEERERAYETVSEVSHRIERAVSERRFEKRQQRREKKGKPRIIVGKLERP